MNVREGKGHVLDPNSPKFDRGTHQKSRIKLEEFSFFRLSRQETYQIMDRFFQGAKTSPACSRICVEASMDATWKIPVLTRCAGHQPNSRVLYTHYKDSLLKGGMTITSPMFQEFTKIGTHTTIHQPGLKLIKSRSKNTVHLHQLQIGPQLQDFFPMVFCLALRFPPWQPWLQEPRLGPSGSCLEIKQTRPVLAVKYDGFENWSFP